MGDQPGDAHYASELAKALNEAKMKGLPDSWTVKLDLVSGQNAARQSTLRTDALIGGWRGPCFLTVHTLLPTNRSERSESG
jgi:hypothetical protein